MKKGKETGEAAFCYVRWESDRRIFAPESRRHRLIRALGAAVSEQGCTICAFTILDDSVHALLHADRAEQVSDRSVVQNLIDGGRNYLAVPAVAGLLRESDVSESYGTAQSLQLPARQERAMPWVEIRDEKGFRLTESDSGWVIHEGMEAVRFCSDIHLLPVRQGYVTNLNDYWFSSWQTYRNRYYWEGLDVGPVLRGLASDREEAREVFRVYQKQRARLLTDS